MPRKESLSVPFKDLKGGIHVQSVAGLSSVGTYPKIIQAAKQAQYRYIFMTEHQGGSVLRRHLEDIEIVMIRGWEEPRKDGAQVLRSDDSRIKIFSDFDGEDVVPEDCNAIEVFDLADSVRAHDDPISWINWLYQKATYPELLAFQLWDIKQENLRLWDLVCSRRPLPATAGNHAPFLTAATGQRLLSILVDIYAFSFSAVSTHVMIPLDAEITEASILDALLAGSSYIAFDIVADPAGFSFHARGAGGTSSMGSEVTVGTELVVQAPVPARFRIIRTGTLYRELEGHRFVLKTTEPGVYRVEVFPLNPPSLIENKPWIISNPIYVR